MSGLAKIVIDTKKSGYENIRNSVLLAAMARGKVYELLHKQIWRKQRWRVWTYDNPNYTHHNGRPVAFIRGWNIKDSSTKPYRYDPEPYYNNQGEIVDYYTNFGLNQLFVGQDFKKPYVGDPKDGIYHDDCFIQPKMIPVTSGEIEAWSYFSASEELGDWENGYYTSYTFDASVFYAEELDSNGQTLVSNVVYESYMDGTTSKHRAIKTYANGTTQTIDLGVRTSETSGIAKAKVREITGIAKTYVFHYDLLGHGEVVHEEFSAPSWTFAYESDQGWTRCYADGTVIQYNPATFDSGDSGGSSPAHYIMLPMVYTDTGELAMPIGDFVDKWEELFELIVHEDRDMFTTIIAAVVIIIISYFTAGAASAAASAAFGSTAGALVGAAVMIGGVMTAVGMLAGNAALMKWGGIVSAVGGIAGFAAGAVNAGASELAYAATDYTTRQASTLGIEVGVAEFSTFEAFVSGAGLTDWVKIGSSAFSLYNQIDQLGMMNMYEMENNLEEDASSASVSVSYGEEEDAVMGLMRI